MYPRAETYFNFGYQKDIHLTEESLKDPSSPLCKYMLFSEWRAYWNLSRPILVEKSPRHVLMTRALQGLFGADNTFFIAFLRHPVWQRMHALCGVTCGGCSLRRFRCFGS